MRSIIADAEHVVCTASGCSWSWMNTEVKIHPPRVSRWRNGLAHWTSNSKVAGSSPARDGIFFPLLQANCASFRVVMFIRILPRWRIFGLFSSRNYSCKKTSDEVCSSLISSELKFLKIHQCNNKATRGSTLNYGLQLQDHTRDETFILPFHSSLQEHLSITRILWIKQKSKPVYTLKLPTNLEIVSCLDPSRFEVKKEDPTESLDNEGDMWRGKWCSSILKKRRSKMNKHKYKKRRKKQKFLRRRLGKWILIVYLWIIKLHWCIYIVRWNFVHKALSARAI